MDPMQGSKMKALLKVIISSSPYCAIIDLSADKKL
jgi:hypothetical protein